MTGVQTCALPIWAALARVIGISFGNDEFQDFEIVGSVPLNASGAITTLSLPFLKTLAVTTLDYQRASAEEEAARAGVTIARSSFFPSLGLNGSIGRDGPAFFPNRSERWSVSAALTFPFFNGGGDYSNLKTSVATAGAAERTREGALRLALERLQLSYSAYVEAVRRVIVDESFQKAASTRAEIGRSKYNNGLLTFEDWDVIENDLINREKAILQTRRERVNAEAAWELALGKGVIE